MAKRKLTMKGGGTIKGIDPLKKNERQFGKALSSMVELMARIYRNQVIEELNKGTVDKFADAQVGNYANVFLGISKKVTKKLKKRFNDERLEKLVKQQLADVNRHNAKKLYGRAEDAIGISAKELYNQEGLTFQINAMELETVQWAKKLRDVSLEDFTSNSLRVMASGGTIDDVLKQFKDMEEKRARHAEMVARTQVATFNSLLTKARAQNLGITEGIWQTANDERVRTCHRVRDGKKFELKEGLYSSCDGKTLMPGQDYNCRCTYELVIPEDEG